MPGDDEIDIDDKILICVCKKYKSVSEIALELEEPRNKIQVHIYKMWKWRQVVRVLNDNKDQGVLGWRYRASWNMRQHMKKKHDINV